MRRWCSSTEQARSDEHLTVGDAAVEDDRFAHPVLRRGPLQAADLGVVAADRGDVGGRGDAVP